MASIAGFGGARATGDERFFMTSALLMALVIVGGFSMQLAMGRSSFAAPLVVHLHAVVFMGWIGIYVTQTALATNGAIGLHRKLGWIGAAWLVAMLVVGFAVMLFVVQNARTPFFFLPQHFVVANPLTLFAFAGLTAAAVVMRRRTDWHRRLHLSGTAMILGPGFGRLLPMPLIAPWAFQAAVVAGLLFIVAGMVVDRRRRGAVHPAYKIGLGVGLGVLLLAEAITYSPLGTAIYDAAVAGTPAADVPGLAFGAPPPGM
jgi:hypothetical protein